MMFNTSTPVPLRGIMDLGVFHESLREYRSSERICTIVFTDGQEYNRSFTPEQRPICVCVHPRDKDIILFGTEDGMIVAFSVSERMKVWELYAIHQSKVHKIATLSNGTTCYWQTVSNQSTIPEVIDL